MLTYFTHDGIYDPVIAYLWTLESAFKTEGFDVASSALTTDGHYADITPIGGIERDDEYGDSSYERKIRIFISEPGAGPDCEADPMPSVGHTHHALPTITINGCGGLTIDQTVNFVRKAFA